ncbi:alkyl/aryl-sulfatase [Candidatus Hepatobacter penaei]|uniref:alkyl/aryl-sulfatase n=1 Tax=Candidatus Hepatobacter penaei TaxID=1274402 RepID=UPI0004F3C422|nr:alkyl sulfatase dimerization domain-containing protein [Candidatus Hepatobacter penaei]
MKKIIALSVLCICLPFYALSKPATEITKKKNQAVRHDLPLQDKKDMNNVTRGFIATLPERDIKDSAGHVVYSMKAFDFIQGKAPDTVNPSLWRQSNLLAKDGLFEVGNGIYQIRSFDIANMTFIRGKTGWIVVDTLLSTETAMAGFNLLRKHVANLPISAVIITHSHADHFGGIKGLVDPKDVKLGKVKLIAPKDFFIESVNENLMAGNHMSRRASYMYGNLLDKSPQGNVGAGLGQTLSTGTLTILEPNETVKDTPTELIVDGIKMLFFYTPAAEAPSEMMFYIPAKKAMCQAEEINHTLHNLYSLRGAQIRNGLKWSKYIHKIIEDYGQDVEISFGSHHWPTWGNQEILSFWKGQRDTYRYIHDEVLRLANHGGTMIEIAEAVKLPESLAKSFANRGYYGSVNHNAKAQYQLYYGFFSGNPAELHPLPPVEAGKKFVEYMGGADAVIRKARRDFDKGEYRWVATALNHVVFADPQNKAAKELLADTYEQMGYQAESGPWRNFYLSGAKELREGVKAVAATNTASPDMVRNLTLEAYLDYLAVRLNHPKAAGLNMTFNVMTPDTGDVFVLYIENGVLNYSIGKQVKHADATVILDRKVLDDINLGQLTVQKAVQEDRVHIEGDRDQFAHFISLLDHFDFWFNIVTPGKKLSTF